MDFGRLLKQFRSRAGLSQERLAELARVSEATVRALEAGRRKAPYRDTVDLLAAALKLSEKEQLEFEVAAKQARARSPKGDSSAAGDPPAPHNIPAQLTSFVGREDEMAEITSLLGKYRLVSVTGGGGIGKTRIAIEIASRVAEVHGDVRFVDLAPISEATFVVSKIAAAVVDKTTDATTVDRLAVILNDRRILLLLDNCEHVIAEVAHVVRVISERCPFVTILATSRERINIAGEIVYRVSPLAPQLAVELFVVRARATDWRFTFTEAQLQTAALICRSVEHIPLAIEIAAARLPLGLDALAKRLDEGASLLAGSRDRPERHQTMLATIEWSYGLLADVERLLLTRAAVFVGGFTLDAAEEVCSDALLPASGVANLLISLINKSLVNAIPSPNGTRYTMLESLRSFGLTKLIALGESSLIARRHAQWIADFADRESSLIYAGTQVDQSARIGVEIDNIRHALDWALREGEDGAAAIGGKIIGGLRIFWLWNRLHGEYRRWARAALDQIDESRDPAIVALVLRGYIQATQGDEMLVAAESAARLFEHLGDGFSGAVLQGHLCNEYCERQRLDEAENASKKAFAFFADVQSQRSLPYASALCHRARLRVMQGRFDEGRADANEALAIAHELGDDMRFWRVASTVQADAAFATGQLAEAVRIVEGMIAAADTSGMSESDLNAQRARLAAYYLLLGNNSGARLAARAALSSPPDQVEDYHHPSVLDAIQQLAAIATLEGKAPLAARLVGFVDALRGRVAYQRGRIDQAIHEVIFTSLRAQLSDAAIDALTATGAELRSDRIVQEAMSV